MADQCWVDAWAFDRLAGQHAAAPAPAAAGQALQLYQGHFLQRESSRGWMHGYRDRLRSRFQRLVATEGSRLEACGRLQDAVAFYERGIELDPLAEALYQRLMCCHRDQGALADVLSVYRRCREHLQFEFGIEPAAATQAIRRTACGVGASPTP